MAKGAVSTVFICICFFIIILANALMLYGYTNYPNAQESFVDYVINGGGNFRNEGFSNYNLSGASAGDTYKGIGAYDNIRKLPEDKASAWRATKPNEPMAGPEFKGPSPDNLFIFKNNQCKPECCGASYSCGGGCVCTTPEQRQYLASRGGNRTLPDDGI
jgi:hypothetical protein